MPCHWIGSWWNGSPGLRGKCSGIPFEAPVHYSTPPADTLVLLVFRRSWCSQPELMLKFVIQIPHYQFHIQQLSTLKAPLKLFKRHCIKECVKLRVNFMSTAVRVTLSSPTEISKSWVYKDRQLSQAIKSLIRIESSHIAFLIRDA